MSDIIEAGDENVESAPQIFQAALRGDVEMLRECVLQGDDPKVVRSVTFYF